ncbi:glycyl-radical enzyme activating protein [Gemmatimonadota bacterium]
MQASGLIFDIKKFAIHDGPGIRTTVFFKGCPLGCLLCHNPESQSPGPEIWLREERCTRCLDCLDVCKQDAITLGDDGAHIDRAKCDLGGACVEICPVNALEVVGRAVSVEEVMAEVEKDAIFYDQSGGGVTFSGGEPLAQPIFLSALLIACHQRGLHTTLDTSGYSPPEVFRDVAPLVDLFLYDLKLMDRQRHLDFTGVTNDHILENLSWLADRDTTVIIRFPPVPGFNDDEENLRAMGAFLRSSGGLDWVDILPYHVIGVGKYLRLEREYPLSGAPPLAAGDISRIVGILREYDLTVTVRGEADDTE